MLQLPGKANVLFDAGSLHRRDIGSRIVAPYLEYAGIAKIDAIIISHNDIDHINGIPEIVEYSHVEHIYANNAFFDRTDKWGTAKFLSERLSEKGLQIERIHSELDLNDNVKIRILWPDEQAGGDEAVSDNDRSLVSLIEFAGARILLCSDIEEYAQKELLRRYPDLGADIVVVPHHGSVSTLVPEFLKKLNATVLICSCDRSQYERMQSATGLVISKPAKPRLYSTAKDGAITIRLDKKQGMKTGIFVQ